MEKKTSSGSGTVPGARRRLLHVQSAGFERSAKRDPCALDPLAEEESNDPWVEPKSHRRRSWLSGTRPGVGEGTGTNAAFEGTLWLVPQITASRCGARRPSGPAAAPVAASTTRVVVAGIPALPLNALGTRWGGTRGRGAGGVATGRHHVAGRTGDRVRGTRTRPLRRGGHRSRGHRECRDVSSGQTAERALHNLVCTGRCGCGPGRNFCDDPPKRCSGVRHRRGQAGGSENCRLCESHNGSKHRLGKRNGCREYRMDGCARRLDGLSDSGGHRRRARAHRLGGLSNSGGHRRALVPTDWTA